MQAGTLGQRHHPTHQDKTGVVVSLRGLYSKKGCREKAAMAKLLAWTMERHQDGDAVRHSAPRKVERSQIGLEKHLEDWIANDVKLIGEGLKIVGRQVKIDDGILDLLAIDSQDRWAVIEIKSGTLGYDAPTQALYYASSIARLDGGNLKGNLSLAPATSAMPRSFRNN